MRIGLLECGTAPEEMMTKHDSNIDDIKSVFSGIDPDLVFVDYAVYQGQLPADPKECDAYVVTGSGDAVYENLPWMLALQDFLRAASDLKKPLLGICFGHQLLAVTFGGVVEKASQGWGVGLHDYQIKRDQDWMDTKKPEISIFVSHKDQVITPPPGAVVLAGSEFCPNAMLQINNHVLSLQGHPEMDRDFGKDLLELRREAIGPDLVDHAIGTLCKDNDRHEVAAWLVGFMKAAVKSAPQHK